MVRKSGIQIIPITSKDSILLSWRANSVNLLNFISHTSFKMVECLLFPELAHMET